MFIDGLRQEIDEDLFNQLVETLRQSDNIHNSPTHTKSAGRQPDGTYNKKPLDPNYFRNHYQKNSKPLTSAPTADGQYQANPTYQSIAKRTGA
jgi:hypothetical protein